MVNGKTQVKPLQKWRFPDPETHIIEIVGNIHKQAEQKDHFADVSKMIEQKEVK
jgi:hypothetical protein